MVIFEDHNVGGRGDGNRGDGHMTFTFMEPTTNSTSWAFRPFK